MAEKAESLRGKVALVTGASRGIGKGIAKVLCQAGAVVYITGRKLGDPSQPLSLSHTANEISAGSKKCIPVACDHGDDDNVKQLFDKIASEQNGFLDILVNNAFGGVDYIFQNNSKPFFEQPLDGWHKIVDVGTRSDYIAACFAAKMMVERRTGLIVNVSSPGGLFKIFNNIPYGLGKEAIDRMSLEMGLELKKWNVACISLWPGAVITEAVQDKMKEDKRVGKMFKDGEDPTFSGKCIEALANDKELMTKSGKIHLTAELAYTYGLKDVNGETPVSSFLQLKGLVGRACPSISWMIPSWIFLPRWFVALKGMRF